MLLRRGDIRGVIRRQFHRRRVPGHAAHFVADPVDDRLAKVRLHRADMARLEHVEPPQGVQRSFLHQIPRVERASSSCRQPPVGPARQRGQAPLQEGLDRHPIAFPRPHDQFEGRFVAEQSVGVGLVPGWLGPFGVRHDGWSLHHIGNNGGRPQTERGPCTGFGILPAMIGTTVAHYRITGKLGMGGMGVVYDGEDVALSRPVALKFLSQDLAGDPDATRRFRREAQTLAGLNHPNICIVYEVAEHEGSVFIAMERVDGINLKLHMARRTLDDGEVVAIALQVAAALEAAHATGIVHRDIKPGNILVSGSGHVKVVDFGLARRFMMPDTGELVLGGSTIPGRPMGTANYMAPERILQLPLDPRSDLFSLGVVIYEMATGKLPFGGASPSETINNVLDRDPVPLTALSPGRPAALQQIVHRLLAKPADGRYQSAADAIAALRRVSPTGWSARFRRMLRG